MKKAFKWISIGGASLFALLIIALVVAISSVNTDTLKNRITSRIEAKIGGTLTVGDLSIYPTPTVRVALKDVAWDHKIKGISANVDRLVVKIPFYQFLGSGPIEATLLIKHPTLKLTTPQAEAPFPVSYQLASGSEETTLPLTVPPADTPEEPENERRAALMKRLAISELAIEDGTVQSGDSNTVQNIQFSFGPIEMSEDKRQDLNLDFSCDVVNGPLKGPISLTGDLGAELKTGLIELSKLKLGLAGETFELNGTVKNFKREAPDQALLDLNLKNPAFDVSKWMKLKDPNAVSEIEGTMAIDAGIQGPLGDLKLAKESHTLPDTLAFNLGIDFSSLKVKGQAVENGHLLLALKNGVLELNPLKISAYGGDFDLTGTVQNLAAVPKFDLLIQAKNFNPKLLPIPAIQEPLTGLEGTVSMTMKVAAEGKDPLTIKQSLSGEGSIDLLAFSVPEKKLKLQGIHATTAISAGRIQFKPLVVDELSFGEPPFTLKNVKLNSTLAESDLVIDSLSSELLKGTLQIGGQVHNLKTAPSFDLQASGKGLDLSLLPPPANKKPNDPYKLGGIAQFSLNTTGAGNTPESIKSSLKANGSFSVANLPLPKMDVSAKMDKGRAPLSPQMAEKKEALQAKIQDIVSVQKLESLTGQVSYSGGGLTLSNTVATNVNYQVNLDGTVSADQVLDFDGNIFVTKVKTEEILQTLALAKGLQEADGRLRIPFSVSGPRANPKLALNMNEMAGKLMKGAIQEIREKGGVREIIKQRGAGGGGPGRVLQGIFNK